eukprot:g23961.t1
MMMSSAFSAMNSSEMDHSPTDGFGRIEMPVPTEVPSPTSPADGLEGATVTATALPVTETVSQARSMHPTEIPEADFSVGVVRGGGGQACFESSSAPHTPTEMPVPTEVSPTTIGEEDEEPTATVPTAIPEPTIPTLPQPEAEADVSGPLASAGYSSAPLPSPEEMSQRASRKRSPLGRRRGRRRLQLLLSKLGLFKRGSSKHLGRSMGPGSKDLHMNGLKVDMSATCSVNKCSRPLRRNHAWPSSPCGSQLA